MKKSHFKQISDGSDWNPVKMRKLEAPVTGLAWRLQRKLSKILLILCEKAFKAADPLLSRPPASHGGPEEGNSSGQSGVGKPPGGPGVLQAV